MAEEKPPLPPELRSSAPQVVAQLKRDFIDRLDLFQVIFTRLPILTTLDCVCVCVTRKQEHTMPFGVSVQEPETLGKVWIKGHEINIPKMTRAAERHLKSLSSQHRHGLPPTPPPPQGAEETRNRKTVKRNPRRDAKIFLTH